MITVKQYVPVSVQVAHIFIPYVLSNLQPYQKS